MSVGDNARIIFDEPTATFMPGQSITGRVLILTRNPKKISSKWLIRRFFYLFVHLNILHNMYGEYY